MASTDSKQPAPKIIDASGSGEAPAKESASTPPAEAEAGTPTTQAVDITEIWQQALDEIKKQYNTLYGIARMARTEFDGDQLTLAFKFAFHQKRVNEAKNRKIFADIMERLYGRPVEIVCVVAEPAQTEADKADVATISNIFGGAELLP